MKLIVGKQDRIVERDGTPWLVQVRVTLVDGHYDARAVLPKVGPEGPTFHLDGFHHDTNDGAALLDYACARIFTEGTRG